MFTLTQFVHTCGTMYICTECETNEEPMAIWEPFNPFSLLCSLKGSLVKLLVSLLRIRWPPLTGRPSVRRSTNVF